MVVMPSPEVKVKAATRPSLAGVAGVLSSLVPSIWATMPRFSVPSKLSALMTLRVLPTTPAFVAEPSVMVPPETLSTAPPSVVAVPPATTEVRLKV